MSPPVVQQACRPGRKPSSQPLQANVLRQPLPPAHPRGPIQADRVLLERSWIDHSLVVRLPLSVYPFSSSRTDCALTRRLCLTHPSSNAARPGDLASYGVSRAAAGAYFLRLAGELKGEGVHVALYTPCVPSCSSVCRWCLREPERRGSPSTSDLMKLNPSEKSRRTSDDCDLGRHLGRLGRMKKLQKSTNC